MKRICKCALFVLMLTVVLLGMTACGKTKLDVTEGVYVSFEGVNGKGSAEVLFSKEDPSDYTPVFLYKLVESKKVAADDWKKILTIGEAITYDLDKSHGLSNGDKVTVKINVNKAILENLDLTAESQELTFTVEGLEEVKTIQPFQNFTISFGGISPDAYVEDYTHSEEIDGATVYYTIEKNSSLRDGQEVTITASIGSNDRYSLAEDTMTVTVTGVEKYISDMSELQAGTLEAMRAKADSVVATQIQNWEGYFHYDGFEFVGYEFWNRHEDSIMGNVNAVYLYYKINANDGGNPFATYYYVGFESILQHLDGSQEVNLDSVRKPSIGLYEELKSYTTLESRTNETASKFGGAYDIQKCF